MLYDVSDILFILFIMALFFLIGVGTLIIVSFICNRTLQPEREKLLNKMV
jgi:hypothetical protein